VSRRPADLNPAPQQRFWLEAYRLSTVAGERRQPCAARPPTAAAAGRSWFARSTASARPSTSSRVARGEPVRSPRPWAGACQFWPRFLIK